MTASSKRIQTWCISQVSALVTLYSHLGDVNTAVEVLDDAVEHAQKNKVSKFDSTPSRWKWSWFEVPFVLQELMRQSETLSLMRENVAYKLQHGKAKEAVDMLEKLHKYVKFLVFYTEEMYRTCTLDKLSLFSQRYRSAFSVHLLGSGLMVGELASASRSRCSGDSWPGGPRGIGLYSWARHFTLTVPFFIQVCG